MKRDKLTRRLIYVLLVVALSIPILFVTLEDKNEIHVVKAECPQAEPLIEVKPQITERIEVIDNLPTYKREEPKLVSLGEFRVTAYCSCPRCCGPYADGLTYTETVATEGRTIAVDPDVIPLGAMVVINGVEYMAEDIGGAIKGERVDIYFDSHQDALEWGIQYLEVFVITFP